MVDQAKGNINFSYYEIILCVIIIDLTQLHSERPKLYTILAFLSAVGLKMRITHNLLVKINFSL